MLEGLCISQQMAVVVRMGLEYFGSDCFMTRMTCGREVITEMQLREERGQLQN